MTDKSLTPEQRRILAAELSLGLLEGSELVQARALADADSGFRDEVGAWDEKLGPLFDEVDPVQPPDSLWHSIERATAQDGDSNVIPLRQKVRFWQMSTGVAAALAASLALALIVQPHSLLPPMAPPHQLAAREPMVAMLTTDQNHPALMASWNPADRKLFVEASAPMPPAPGRSHQLWVIPADGTPRSMGVMPATGPMSAQVGMPMAGTLAEGVTLAVSDEPEGGSPTGQPTGPVIASGKLAKV